MQAAGQRTRKRLSAGPLGSNDKQLCEKAQKTQQPLTKKHKRSSSDVAEAPPAKKRRSAPELPKSGAAGHATPPAPSRYNLRSRSSMPAAGTRLTDGSLPASGPRSLPSSVRPRNPNQKATWSELPDEVLKVICQHLDTASIYVARGVSSSMRDACSTVPVQLRFTLPMQSSPWSPIQLEAWMQRVNGVAGLLSSGRMQSSELQLRMEGAEAWRDDENIPAAQINNCLLRLSPLLSSLHKLSPKVAETALTHLDVELPISMHIVLVLRDAFPDLTSLRLDNLIPPPSNHVQFLSESRQFSKLRKLDVCVTAWDQLQYLASFTQLEELNIRYKMWNIPELTPLTPLQKLTKFGFEVQDDRARFQLDFLGPLVRGVRCLSHVRAAVILSRTVASESGPAALDCLIGSQVTVLDLDVRVPQDAARVAHVHLRNLQLAPPACKVNLTIRADALMRETSYESAATRTGFIAAPRLGMASPSSPEPRERWGALNMIHRNLAIAEDAEPTLQLHLTGYRLALCGLPDMGAAGLTHLQITHARLSPSDFMALADCTTLRRLFVRFAFVPDPIFPGSSAAFLAALNNSTTTTGTAGAASGAATAATAGGALEPLKPREMQASLNARLAVSGCHGMLTRGRRGQQASRRSTGGTGGAAAAPAPDCADTPAAYVLKPLLELRNLQSLELLEEQGQQEEEEGQEREGKEGAMGAGAGPKQRRESSAASAAGGETDGSGKGPRGPVPRPGSKPDAADAVTKKALPPSRLPSSPLPPLRPDPEPLPISRSGLTHFLRGLGSLRKLTALSLQLLTEEEALPDCPCKTSCFGAESGKGAEPPAVLDAGAISRTLGPVRRFKVVLGSQQVVGPEWFRPSAWPSLEG